MPDALLVAHASSSLSNPVALATVGALMGAAITGIVHANRRLDSPDPAPDRPPGGGSTERRPRIWGSPTMGLAIVLISIGLVAGYAAATLLDSATAVRSPQTLVDELCDAARSTDPAPGYLALDDDIQHNLTDLDADRARRAAAIVRSAANRPGQLDPELVQLLATELANAAELGGGTPCN